MTQEAKQVIEFLLASLENKDQTIQQQQTKIAELDQRLKEAQQLAKQYLEAQANQKIHVAEKAAAANN